MKILFDQNVPRNLRQHVTAHEVTTAAQMGWSELENGVLLATAEAQGFELFLTGDRNLEYQQNLTTRKIAIIALTRNNWPLVKPHVDDIVAAISKVTPGSYQTVGCSPQVTPEASSF